MSGPDAFGTNPYVKSRPVPAELVTLLRGVAEDRGLKLEAYRSRAVSAGQVHELMTTDEDSAGTEQTVNRVGLIGFVEMTRSGVLLVGARVTVGGRFLGTIAGFDDTHMPNHQNICIKVETLRDGVDLNFRVGDPVVFERAD